ncbi:extracellular solute-binding protein [Paenibacillus sp. OAS669]|uniref:extracellular solute-binding protein n=1 Tax=Paenibacillus sp. OAS669 TaxID=2663821 RepID=UPI0019FF424F|nr:extracellular solute-binding protein [Paenibacillus sp. OAS669]MBE1444465.1 putative aldouronate transport system substrate-binding protein [Paenibacillus sp. OAS669]
MDIQRKASLMSILLLLSVLLTACTDGTSEDGGKGSAQRSSDEAYPLTFVVNQAGAIPPKDNEMEKAIQAYTQTDLQIQWIPTSGYDEKVNVMIASNELPKLIKLNYTPTIMGALKSDLFWEIGPYLKDYKNLSAQDRRYYDNIAVNGKIYGVPLFRELGRAAVHYRKDWFDALGVQLPQTLDEWYSVIKLMAKGDPDHNGKDDTYGFMLDKKYNQDTSSTLTRFTVAQGGPNKWKVENGEFIPEFMTEPFFSTMKLFRKLYEEKLINQDFAVVDATEIDKAFESGRTAIRMSGGNAQTMQDKLIKAVPTAVIDAAPVEGPFGRRLPGESGNAGFLAIPRDTVQTVDELKRILKFIDQLMDPPMATLLVKGLEGRHWEDKGEFTVPLNPEADAREVKPYRDALPQRNESYNISKPMKQSDLYLKNNQITKENEKYIVVNPALTLDSATFSEKGRMLEQLISDAETNFIMGKIDEAGWKAEIERWKQAGGEKMAQEYKAAYERGGKQ